VLEVPKLQRACEILAAALRQYAAKLAASV
jgi:hypothetical protein